MPPMRTQLLVLLLPTLVLAACASGPPARRSASRTTCVNTAEINVMRPLDDRHVFVRLGANHNYLFTMDPCQGLSLARKLAVWEATSRVCADGVSLLSFEEPTVGEMRCRISKIDPVADMEAALELIRAEGPSK